MDMNIPSNNVEQEIGLPYCPFEGQRRGPPRASLRIEGRIHVLTDEVHSILQEELIRSKMNGNTHETKRQQSIIQTLKNDNNIYLPSDKGGEMVVMGKEQYVALGLEHLGDSSTYNEVMMDKSQTTLKQMNALWRLHTKSTTLPKHIVGKINAPHCQCPQFYHDYQDTQNR